MGKSIAPTFVSLFSGCGGLDLGFTYGGFKGSLSVDIDDAALTVHRAFLASPTQKLDLTHANPSLSRNEHPDVLLAGSPCQGFSTAGKRILNDPRNSLLFVVARVADQFKPKVAIVENVPGALSGEHLVYWKRLHELMRALGYKTSDLRVNSADLGVPQVRRRIFLVCWRTSADLNLPSGLPTSSVLKDVLHFSGHTSNHEPKALDELSTDFRIALKIAPGQKLTNARGGPSAVHTWHIPEVFGRSTKLEKEVLEAVLKLRRQVRRREFGDADPVSTKLLTSQFGCDVLSRLVSKGFLRQVGKYHDLTHTFNGKYRRLVADAPSRTVDTRFGDPKLFLHPAEHRAFTVREAARIQGFPDDMVFYGTRSQQFRMIGNAVPPLVGRYMAQVARTLL